MTALPQDATLAMVRLYLDQPRMRGFHHFLLIDRPGKKRVKLLHLVHLTELAWPRAALGNVTRGPVEPRTLAALLRRRRKDLVHHKRRHAGGLVGAVLARLDQARGKTAPKQLDLEQYLEGAA